MNRWFRMYDELANDPKVMRLSAEDFRGWVVLLCLANRNGGILPDFEHIAYTLQIDENGARTLVERLVNASLIDPRNGGRNGRRYAVHGWDKRQYKSDSSTDRVKRFRNGQRNVSETATKRPQKQKQNRTESAPLPPANLNGKNGSANGHATDPDPITVEEVIEAWNDTADRHDLPRIAEVSGERRCRVERLIAEHDFERWTKVITSIRQSGYLHGDNKRGWRITFDWMLEPENFTKILEGNYDDRPAQAH
jgi:DNA-binding IscR family transcriptional regulator